MSDIPSGSTSSTSTKSNMIAYDSEFMSDCPSYFNHEDTFGSSVSPARGQQLNLNIMFRRRQSAPALMETEKFLNTIAERQETTANKPSLPLERRATVDHPAVIPDSPILDNRHIHHVSETSTTNPEPRPISNALLKESTKDILASPAPKSPGLITRIAGLFSHRNDLSKKDISATSQGPMANLIASNSLHNDITDYNSTQTHTDRVPNSAPISSGIREYFGRRKASITNSDLNAYAPTSM